MIPKVIHYCWFGGKPLPDLAIKCIESWKKYCPDYEIKRWDENNFNINCCEYAKEAYKAKKWAFVSDYARFKILYENGGLYFDTDVEIIQSLNEIIERGPFMGIEKDMSLNVAPGLGLAAEPKMKIYKELLDLYSQLHFLSENGNLNLTTVVTYTTNLLIRHGLSQQNNIQKVSGIYIYPSDYFCPKNFMTGKIELTSNTVAIHHFDCSWYSQTENYSYELRSKLSKILPYKFAGHISYFIAQCKYDGIVKAVKRTLNKIPIRGR